MKKFLPLGSVVKIQGINSRIMVTGFLQKEREGEKVWDYCAVLFPNGVLDSENMILFDNEVIEVIYFIGMQDPEVFSMMKELSERAEVINGANGSEEQELSN